MEDEERFFSPRNTASSFLDRAIKQQWASDGSSRESPTRKALELGSGWLYSLGGATYYSPNCYRPAVEVPPTLEHPNAGVTRGSTYDYQMDRYRKPQWLTKAWAYLVFVPLFPELSAPPLHPLLRLPGIVDDPDGGPRPDPDRWNEWQELQYALTQSCHLLLADSGAPAVRSVAYPCSRVERRVETGFYRGKSVWQLHRDISSANAWFDIWIGCLSYAIAVNEAVIRTMNDFQSPSICVPLSWIEILLAPYQRHYEEREKQLRLGLSIPHPIMPSQASASFSSSIRPASSTKGTAPREGHVRRVAFEASTVIDPAFVSNLRSTCIADFADSIERVGVFVMIPSKPEDMISIDWLLQCHIPVWYAWGARENEIVKEYPSLSRYKPPADAIWVTTPSSMGQDSSIRPNDTDRTATLNEDVQVHAIMDSVSVAKSDGTRYERRKEAKEGERVWEEFFRAADSDVQSLKRIETPQATKVREARELNPPCTRPEAKFYVWERSMRGSFKRRVATDEDLEELFHAQGRFGRRQARYCSFYNEWDLCREFGPPDDNQLLHRAGVRARLLGTTIEEELIWWRVYYGLQPDPSAKQTIQTSSEPLQLVPLDENSSNFASLISSVFESRSHEHLLNGGHPIDAIDAPLDHWLDGTDPHVEDGEVTAPQAPSGDEAGLSEVSRHAYYFLGATLPLDSIDDPAKHVTIRENPAHTPRLLGIQHSKEAEAFWDSREGQSLIRFAKSLASNVPPTSSSWDLQKWNATPIASLPLFKRLKTHNGCVVVQIEKWDNVTGRSAPSLSREQKGVFWLDIPAKVFGSDLAWFLGSQSAALALAFCRLGVDFEPDPLSLATYLASKGVPFNTWFKRTAEQAKPLERVRVSPQLIPFRFQRDYKFGEKDFKDYERCRRRLLDGPAGRGAVRHGGIVWRIAMQDIGIRNALSGLPSLEALRGERVLRQGNDDELLVDDCLNQDEIMAICGEYEVGIAQGNQKGRKSWWPPPDIWEECHGLTGWSQSAETFFQIRMTQIRKSFTPMSRSEWRRILHPSAALKKARLKIEAQSTEVCIELLAGKCSL